MKGLASILGAIIFVLPGPTGQLKDDRPNILWLVTEDNSKHFMQLYDSIGVAMPTLETLAKTGITFKNMISQAPVCSVARSIIISGCYPNRIGTQYHRHTELVPMPDGLDMFPAYLRRAGYYTTNNSKEDYNIVKGDDVWDESSREASYKNRKPGQPFFHVQNFGISHEGQLHFSKEEMEEIQTSNDVENISLFPYHPNTRTFRYTYAKLFDQHQKADLQLAQFLEELEKEDLLDKTIIFYYGDHGGVLPRSKGYIYESGLHVPLIVHIPEKWSHLAPSGPGSSINDITRFIDLAPTILHLAGIDIPEEMDGRPFLGINITIDDLEKRELVFSTADRFDEKIDLVRSVRQGRFKYIRNYQAFLPDDLHNFYRFRMLAWKEWRELNQEGKLNDVQSQFFQARPVEQLFDLENDPHEIRNLAGSPEHRATLKSLRTKLQNHLKSLPDLSFIPESEFVKSGIENPVEYGQRQKKQIRKLIDIADLSLQPFLTSKVSIEKALNARSPWERYWGLITCSHYGSEAKDFYQRAKEMAERDPVLLVRARALEFLALCGQIDPADKFIQILKNTSSATEASQILNCMTYLEQAGIGLDFTIPIELFNPTWTQNPNSHIVRRLEFLNNPG